MLELTGKTAAEIADSVRALIQEGKLTPGDVLPSARDLSGRIGVNRNTITAAYQRLVKAGLAMTQGRLGTVICEPFRPGEQEGLCSGTALIDLADGNPNPDWLPEPAQLMRQGLAKSYLYGEETILPALRQIAVDWFTPDCPADWQLELTHGAVDAIERLAVARLAPGDSVALETPCFLGTINALRLAGAHTLGVEIDEQGMIPEALRSALQNGARAVFITPRAQNPTGCSLTEQRAKALREVLSEFPNVLVVVDDHFCLPAETAFFQVIPDTSACWAIIRSVSKGLGPDMRVALLACDPLTADRLRARLAPGMTWVSHILQSVVVEGLTSDYSRNRIMQARQGYCLRRNELLDALQEQGIEVPRSCSGLNVWITLSKDARAVAYELAKRGWLVRVGSTFDVSGHCEAIRVTISQLKDGQARQFARDLKSCL